MAQGQAAPNQTVKAVKRLPKVGDAVCYRTWGMAPEIAPYYAIVARVMGTRVNLSVLLGTGAWVAEGPVEFDPIGALEGHWSWPRE